MGGLAPFRDVRFPKNGQVISGLSAVNDLSIVSQPPRNFKSAAPPQNIPCGGVQVPAASRPRLFIGNRQPVDGKNRRNEN